MSNEQLAIYIRQIESRLVEAYDTLHDTLIKDEKYTEQGKGVFGQFKHVPLLKPLGDLQSDLDNSIELLQKRSES